MDDCTASLLATHMEKSQRKLGPQSPCLAIPARRRRGPMRNDHEEPVRSDKPEMPCSCLQYFMMPAGVG